MKLIKKLLLACLVFLIIAIIKRPITVSGQSIKPTFWMVQSIDTMKYSRDIAREKLNDQSFVPIVDEQVRKIASTGANYIAIATPYDQEFVPFMKVWVASARKYGLKVWFRGNVSGWEGWFNYPKVTQIEHTQKVKEFILANEDIFADGDILSSCPECENGGTGDPRQTGNVESYRNFLINEYSVTRQSFKQIKKNVATNYFSMNADVAALVMDKTTTKALDGIVVIDHYVASPDNLVKDIVSLSNKTGGKIVLGEWGAPIPDINGNMTETEQSNWVRNALSKLSDTPELIGLNYWVNTGGSTQLWGENGAERKVVSDITTFYAPNIIKGTILNELDEPIENVLLKVNTRNVYTNASGSFEFPNVDKNAGVVTTKDGYDAQTVKVANLQDKTVLIKTNKSIIFQIRKFLHNLHII